jgi:hypothetical protein
MEFGKELAKSGKLGQPFYPMEGKVPRYSEQGAFAPAA